MKTRIVDLLFISLFTAIYVLLLPNFLSFPRGSQLVEAVKARKKSIEIKYFCFNQNNLNFTGLFKLHKQENMKYSIHSTLNMGRSRGLVFQSYTQTKYWRGKAKWNGLRQIYFIPLLSR